MHLEEVTPAPEQPPSEKPEPMVVDFEAERSPTSLNANHQGQNIVNVEEEITRISSIPPAVQGRFTPLFTLPPTAGATDPTYETPLYLLSFQKKAHSTPEPEVSGSLPLLASLFPRSKRTSDYEGVFTQRGARSRAEGLLKHLRSSIDSNPRPGTATALS